MKIYVDADACPVKDSIINIAQDEDLRVVLVKSFSHFSHEEVPEHVDTIYVDTGTDVADFQIIKLAQRNDIVITQDYGLASLCLGKGCFVLHQKGFAYTHKNIDRLLQSRHEGAMARRSGERTKGPKPFTKEDEASFEKLLKQTIHQNKQLKH
ncbi:MAG TPA: YaiI/YqxD family protein [Virgibacillus sp.]|nr:YaiI/YqxD family protein [Virgibacillus sp.]